MLVCVLRLINIVVVRISDFVDDAMFAQARATKVRPASAQSDLPGAASTNAASVRFGPATRGPMHLRILDQSLFLKEISE